MKLHILGLLTPKRRVGNLGERAAEKFLRKKGYRIRRRNYEAAGHEIDLIAETKEVRVFVEVKTRTAGRLSPKEARPASAVTKEKQRAIISAAKYYAAFQESTKRMRFDVIEVYLRETARGHTVEKIDHLIGAFNGDTAYPKRAQR